MNKTIYTLTFLFTLLFSSALIAWEINNIGSFKFELISSSPNVYIMHGPLSEPNKENMGFINNPGFIESKSGIIVIDPGSTYGVGKNVLAEIKKISKKPVLAVFNTHIHGDHWFANQTFKEAYPKAKFYASQRMIKQANGDKGITWLNSMLRMTEGLSKDTIITPPTIIVENGNKIEVDQQTFVIYGSDKSHTNTDIMIEHKQSQTLFIGDNAFRLRFGQFDESSDIRGNIAALQKAKALNIKQYVPGHGATGSYEYSIQPYLSYLLQLKKAVKIGYDEGLEDFEIKEKIKLDFMSYSDWAGFDIVFGKHINKMFLELESASW